ncbi:MFS transporter [Glutamicibacter arilaitensis]|uniref:MFS transporter n=1 Tax=Glutamicibacter arilaitensis TaxID=256701 RepID=A0A4Y8TTV6_9MICC|nr:MFS transporter [Glutamicibacter arilaitensis]TFH54964.1 MFS transporter [Glutamicibacter arilaitensis]
MSNKETGTLRTFRPLLTRDYRLLFAAVALEVFGTGLWTIVMVFQVIELNDSPLALSAVATGLSLGLFSCSVLGGIIADRFSKRKILVIVQGITALVMATTAALSMTGMIELWHIGLASFFMGAGSAFFYPAYSAYLPQVLPPEQLLAANGLEGAVRPSMGQGLGPAVGGLVVGAFFPAIGAVIVAVSYLLAFAILLFLQPQKEPSSATDPAEKSSLLNDLRSGVKYVAGTRWLFWTLIFGSVLALIVQGPVEVLLPFLARDRFDDAEATFGFLLAAYGIGGAVGSLVVSSMKLPRRYLTFMLLCWGGGTLPLAVLGLASQFWVMLGALFIVGAATGAGVVIWGTLLQRLVPLEMLGRVASLDFFVSIAFMPVSVAIAGPLSLVMPVETIFILAGVVPALIAVLAIAAGKMRSTEEQHRLDA